MFSGRFFLVELLHRYSNRPDLYGRLVRTWEEINNPTFGAHETITTVHGRTASPHYHRTILTDQQLAAITEAYKSGTTAKVLAEHYGVHITTIKRKLRKFGVKRG